MIEIYLILGMLGATFLIGRYLEQKHFRTLVKREKTHSEKLVLTTKILPEGWQVQKSDLAVGSVVISVDYFKSFVAIFKLLLGGELRSFGTLIERGRREAILRMKESSPDANLYLNVRLETSTISRGEAKTIGSVEVICYATAVRGVRM